MTKFLAAALFTLTSVSAFAYTPCANGRPWTWACGCSAVLASGCGSYTDSQAASQQQMAKTAQACMNNQANAKTFTSCGTKATANDFLAK